MQTKPLNPYTLCVNEMAVASKRGRSRRRSAHCIPPRSRPSRRNRYNEEFAFEKLPCWNCILPLASSHGNLVIDEHRDRLHVRQFGCPTERSLDPAEFFLQLFRGLGRVPWDESPFFRFQ